MAWTTPSQMEEMQRRINELEAERTRLMERLIACRCDNRLKQVGTK
jgi:hypothetical protein